MYVVPRGSVIERFHCIGIWKLYSEGLGILYMLCVLFFSIFRWSAVVTELLESTANLDYNSV